MPSEHNKYNFENIFKRHPRIGRSQFRPSETKQNINRNAWTSSAIRQLNTDGSRRRQSERLQVSGYEKFSPSAKHYQISDRSDCETPD